MSLIEGGKFIKTTQKQKKIKTKQLKKHSQLWGKTY